MKAIYKYPLGTSEEIEIEMPEGAIILTVQSQNNEPQMWALVDNLAEPEIRNFKVVSTGEPLGNSDLDYLGSFQINDGLIFHVFEVINDSTSEESGD